MDRQEAIELMPLYLAGGLAPDRRGELEEAMEADRELREELEKWRRVRDLHVAAEEPPLEDVIAYVEGSLESAERPHIQAWIDSSEAARDEVSRLRRSLAATEAAPESSSSADFSSDLESSTVIPFRGRRSTHRQPWRSLLLAAGLASVVTSLLWWSIERPTPDSLRQANVPILEVLPESAGRRGAPVELHELSTEGASVVLILVSENDPGEGELRLDAVDDEGRTIFSLENLVRDPRGEFTVALPSTIFDRPLELRVIRVEDGSLVERYLLEPPAAGP